MIAMALLAAAMVWPPVAQAQAVAAAQEAKASESLGWLFGKFCTRGGKPGAEEEVCLTFAAEPDGSVSGEWARQLQKGKAIERSRAVLRVEDGRLVLRSEDQESEYREVSRGPNRLLMENVTEGEQQQGDMKTARYQVDGDVLTLTYELFGGRTAVNTYTRRR